VTPLDIVTSIQKLEISLQSLNDMNPIATPQSQNRILYRRTVFMVPSPATSHSDRTTISQQPLKKPQLTVKKVEKIEKIQEMGRYSKTAAGSSWIVSRGRYVE